MTEAKDRLLDSPSSSDDKELQSNGKAGGIPSICVVEDAKEVDVADADEILFDENKGSLNLETSEPERCKSWIEWLKTPFFYKVTPMIN